MRYLRIRWLAKWIGATACLFLIAIWIYGRFRYAQVGIPVRHGSLFFDQERGLIGAAWFGPSWPYVDGEFHLFILELGPPKSTFEAGGFYWWREQMLARTPTMMGLVVPIWIPLIAVLVPTVMLWRADRNCRAGSNDCENCGYSLVGNVSGTCPECGTVATVQGLQE